MGEAFGILESLGLEAQRAQSNFNTGYLEPGQNMSKPGRQRLILIPNLHLGGGGGVRDRDIRNRNVFVAPTLLGSPIF